MFIKNFLGIALGLLIGILVFSPFLIIFIYHKLSTKIICGTKWIKFRREIKKIKKNFYFRDIPCEDIFEAYWISCQFGLVKNKYDFLGVMLLKWLKNKNIEIVKASKIKLKFNNDNQLFNDEKELYNMMKKASKNNILEEKEFSKWCDNNYLKIVNWFNKVFDKQTQKLYKEGKLTKTKEKEPFGKFFNNENEEKEVYYIEKTMEESGLKVAGLKNFLNDFSNIKDRRAIEIIHWEEYLMYAQMFGIAEKVAKEFKDLYPETINGITYDSIVSTYNFSHIGINSINRSMSSSSFSRKNSQDKANRYSAGGKGYSSGGGASDSFGKGAGGGGVR